VTARNDLHFKLVFFDFDVRFADACSEADFVEELALAKGDL